MKNLVYILLIITAGTFGLNTATLAGGGGYGKGGPAQRFENRVDRRQGHQWSRIRNGMESGSLSRREAKRLRKDQRKIARMERRFERDGYYSRRERRAMEHALDRASRRIKRAKHNDYERPYRRHHRGWHGHHHRYPTESYTYAESDDGYVGSSSSTSISAELEGITVSWSTSNQH
jgi:hypothetical protein